MSWQAMERIITALNLVKIMTKLYKYIDFKPILFQLTN